MAKSPKPGGTQMSRLSQNLVLLAGNAVRDGEVKVLTGGNSYYRFTIAQGKADAAVFLDVTYWPKKYTNNGVEELETVEVRRGDNVAVEGSIRQWKDKETGKTAGTAITAFRMTNMSRQRAGAEQPEVVAGSEEVAPVQTEQVPF